MADETLLQTHPHLQGFLVSRHPWLTLRTVLPLLAGFAWMIVGSVEAPGLAVVTGALLFGAVFWTFFEYAMHRWIYHARFRSPRVRRIVETFHMHHHRFLGDQRVINAGPLMAIPVALLIFLPFLLVLPSALVGWCGVGFILTYHAYEWIHYNIHLRKFERGYMNHIQRFHLFHHERAWGRNYGNTSGLWDHVFSTFDPRSRDYQIGPEVEALLYVNQEKGHAGERASGES